MAKVNARDERRSIISRFIPEEAVDVVLDWQDVYKFQLRITKTRTSKLGDYRPPHQDKSYHRISVNHELNHYAFLLTLTHEVAHLITWDIYKRSAQPHGPEWKHHYARLLEILLMLNIFPEDVVEAVKDSMSQPAASSCAEVDLLRVLRKYDKEPVIFLDELKLGEHFEATNGRTFQKGEKRRTRFVCKELSTGRLYLFSAISTVRKLNEH